MQPISSAFAFLNEKEEGMGRRLGMRQDAQPLPLQIHGDAKPYTSYCPLGTCGAGEAALAEDGGGWRLPTPRIRDLA